MSELSPESFEEDQLHLREFKVKLEQFLKVEHHFVEGSLVVSLNARFGSGKSTFLRMWKNDLDARRQNEPETPRAIVMNAWESDYCGDPLLAVVTGLVHEIEKGDPDKGERLRESLKDIGWFTLGLANSLASAWGVNPIDAGKFAEEKKPKKPDFVKLYEERQKALKGLKEALTESFGGSNPATFIFVDELDRCRPDYAVQYLETIKHVFDIHGLIFILAVDSEQLASSARALFGENLNFPEYYRKFSQRSFTLPLPDIVGLQGLARIYGNNFLAKDGLRFHLMNPTDFFENVVQLITAFKMTPRQCQEVYRIIGHVASSEISQQGYLLRLLAARTALMAVLKVVNSSLYEAIGNARQDHEEVARFLVKGFDEDNARWWCDLYFSGINYDVYADTHNAKAFFQELGLVSSAEEFDFMAEMKRMYDPRGGFFAAKQFPRIYTMIEGAMTF